MILSIENERGQFSEFDFEEILYVCGENRQLLWELYRSLFYYFEKSVDLSENIYGEDGIEIKIDGVDMSKKNTTVYFINSRESIYRQMSYRKNTLLYDLINSCQDSVAINQLIEQMNDEMTRIAILLQETLQEYTDSLVIDFKRIDFASLLKDKIEIGYQTKQITYPLAFMSTDDLIDEYFHFLEFHVQRTSTPIWLVLYNLDSYLSRTQQRDFMRRLKTLTRETALKVIDLSNNLNAIHLEADDIGQVVVAADELTQLLPYSELRHSIERHYPNELLLSDTDLVTALKLIIPSIGAKKITPIGGRNLVLLKVMDQLLGYKTILDPNMAALTNAEMSFLSRG